MTASEDISNLFRKFGGEEDGYQEIVRQDQASESRARWPLLSAVNLSDNGVAPAVNLPDGAVVPAAPMKAAPTLHAPAPVGAAPPTSGPFGPSSVQTEDASAPDSADVYVPGPDETVVDGDGRAEPDLVNSPEALAARATTVMNSFRRPGPRAARASGAPLQARNPRDPRDALQRFAANPSAPRANAGLRQARWTRPASDTASQAGNGAASRFASQPALPSHFRRGAEASSRLSSEPATGSALGSAFGSALGSASGPAFHSASSSGSPSGSPSAFQPASQPATQPASHPISQRIWQPAAQPQAFESVTPPAPPVDDASSTRSTGGFAASLRNQSAVQQLAAQAPLQPFAGRAQSWSAPSSVPTVQPAAPSAAQPPAHPTASPAVSPAGHALPRREGSLLSRMFANASQPAAASASTEPAPVSAGIPAPGRRDLLNVFARLAGKPGETAPAELPAAAGASLFERLNRL